MRAKEGRFVRNVLLPLSFVQKMYKKPGRRRKKPKNAQRGKEESNNIKKTNKHGEEERRRKRGILRKRNAKRKRLSKRRIQFCVIQLNCLNIHQCATNMPKLYSIFVILTENRRKFLNFS